VFILLFVRVYANVGVILRGRESEDIGGLIVMGGGQRTCGDAVLARVDPW
jgi:hypothetical protein